jgi:hypothetical protein
MNPQTTGNLTFIADRDYKDPIAGTTYATGATVTLTPNTGLLLIGTAVGTPNSGAPSIAFLNPAAIFSDSPTQTVQVSITDPDGIASVGHLFQDGVDIGALTNMGGGLYQKTGVTFTANVASLLSVTATDAHSSPLSRTQTFTALYQTNAPPPPPPPPPAPPAVAEHYPAFATQVLEDLTPVDQ